MKIKKYVVDSLPDAMQQIKHDLGQEAIIINTKKIKTGGFLGLFRKQQIEVLAALDPGHQDTSKPRARPTVQHRATVQPIKPSFGGEGVTEPIYRRKEEPVLETGQLFAALSTGSHPPQPKLQQVAPAINQKAEVKAAIQETGGLDPDLIGEIKSIKKYLLTLMIEKEELLSPALKKVNQQLSDQGVSQEIIMTLTARLLTRIEAHGEYTEAELIEWTKEEIVSLIRSKGCKSEESLAKMTCFIGPTGVGKTTTIAKIAADLMLKQRKKIGFITSDTYRVAAVEQLKTYANILNIPTEIVYSAQDLPHAVQQLDSCDVILMDTAGRNYLEKDFVVELEELLESAEEVKISMVLSLTSKYQDIKKVIESFNPRHIDFLLLTKLDETKSYGMMLNLIDEYGIPFSYVTNGQNVPDDIKIITPEDIADLILGEDAHG